MSTSTLPLPLTQHDISILEKIKDPESNPSSTPLLIDTSNSPPEDPHITDPVLYHSITQLERSIITSIQAIEFQIAGFPQHSQGSNQNQNPEPPLTQYLTCVTELGALISKHPNYASARNNRAQALRRIYGDHILVSSSTLTPAIQKGQQAPLATSPSEDTLSAASTTILGDLSNAISLLTPPTPYSPISAQAARTLSQAYTQRGAVYLLTSKMLTSSSTTVNAAALRIDPTRKEAGWSKHDFEENASRDFTLGGRYGNEVAKALAVATNPAAKLCGAIVKEAMRKEFGVGVEAEN